MTIAKNNVEKLIRMLMLQGVVVVLGFLFTISVTRMAGVDAYGQISYLIAIANIVMSVMRWGTDETLIVSMTQMQNPRLEIAAATLLRGGLFLTYLSVGLLAVALGAVIFKEVLVISSVLLLAFQVTSLYDYFAQQHRHIHTVIIGKFLLLSGFTGAMALGVSDTLTLFLIGSGLGNMALLSLQYRYFRHCYPRGGPENPWASIRSRSRGLITSNYMVMLASLLSLGLYSANQIYIKHALTLADLGVFAVQWQVCTVLFIYMKQVNRVYKPILVRLHQDKPTRFVRASWLFFLALTLLPVSVSLTVWHFYDQIFPTIFSAELAGYKPMFLLLTLFIFLRGAHMTLTQLCFVMSRNNLSFFANAAGTTTIAATILLMSGYSRIEDAAIALNAAIAVMIVVTAALMSKPPVSCETHA